MSEAAIKVPIKSLSKARNALWCFLPSSSVIDLSMVKSNIFLKVELLDTVGSKITEVH